MTDGTIFSDPFAPPGKPAPEILRNGRYHLPPVGDPTGRPLSRQRVTNFVKAVSDSYALDQWKMRRVVVGLSRREDLYDLARGTAADDKATLGSIVDQALEAAKVFEEGGADTGTAFHAYTDQVDRGQPHTARAKWAPKLENYTRAMRAHGLEVVPAWMERRVVIERFNLGGTLDRILRSSGTGELFIGDLKSQKSFYTWWEIALQLALYSEADAMWNPDTLTYEDMPPVSRDLALVAWMPVVHPGADRDAVTFYDVDLTEARPCLDLVSNVLAMRKGGTKWGRPRALPVEQAAPIHDEEAYARYLHSAGTTADVEKIAHEATQRGVFSDMLRAIAATRWEWLDQTGKAGRYDAGTYGPEPVVVHGTAATVVAPPGREEAARLLATQDGAAELARATQAVARHYPDDTRPDARSGQDSTTTTADTISDTMKLLSGQITPEQYAPGFAVNGQRADHVRAMTFSGPVEPVDPFRQPYDSARGWSGFPDAGTVGGPFVQPEGGSASFGVPDLRGVVERMSVADVADLLNTPGATYTTPPDLRAFAANGATGAPEVVRALAESVRHVPVLTPPDPPEGDSPSLVEVMGAAFAAGGLALDRDAPPDPSPEVVGTAEDQGVDIGEGADLIAMRQERADRAGVPAAVIAEVIKRAGNSTTPRGRTRLLNDLARKYAPDSDERMKRLSDLVHAVWGADEQADGRLREEMKATKEAVRGDTGSTDADVVADLMAGGYTTPDDTVTVAAFDQPAGATPAQDQGAAVEDFEAERRAVMRPEYGRQALGAIGDVEELVRLGEASRSRPERTAVITEVGRRHAWTDDINRRLIIEHPGFPGDVTYTGPKADLSAARVVEEIPAAPALVLNPQRAVALEQVKDALDDAGSTAEIQRIWGEAARRNAWTEELEAHALACMRKAPR